MTSKDGATVDPYSEKPSTNECMQRWRHSWHWKWLDGKWTNTLRCQTCGAEKLARKEDR